MASDQKEKRKRNPNYSEDERNLLLSLVHERRNIIESKESNAVHWKQKESAWIEIEKYFNAQNSAGRHRSIDSLKCQYKNIKEQVRKMASSERKSMKRTGGGPKDVNTKDKNFELALATINQKTIYGLVNNFDGDASSDEYNTRSKSQEEVSFENSNLKKKDPKYTLSNTKSVINCVTETTNSVTDDFSNSVDNDMVSSNQELDDDYSKNIPPSEMNESVENIELQEATLNWDKKNCNNSHQWQSRRRPLVHTLHSSKISEVYENLANAKLQATNAQAEMAKAEHVEIIKKIKLEQESIQWDTAIKKAHLKKLNNDYSLPGSSHFP